MTQSVKKVLQDLIDGDDLKRIKFAPGVVGNTTTAIVVALLATAAEAYSLREQPAVMFGAMLVTLVLVIVYLFGTWRFAERHPDLALMGGAELLQLRQMQLGAKDKRLIVEGQPLAGMLGTSEADHDA